MPSAPSSLPSSLPSFLAQLSGYTVVQQLYLGTRTAVYRMMQTAHQRPVVVKVLRHDYPSFDELVQFRNQYEIAKSLPVSGIVHPLHLEPLGSGYALVMEDWGGISLKEYAQQQSLTVIEVLMLAIQVSEILHTLYQHRVVHKDIKPANILIHLESKQVKLIDFSIASLLPKETQEIQCPSVLEGTLAYIAPEQTGRMNRGIDHRADFYAFGVTLYQLLTGSLPFASDDPLELVHCHIARSPVPADRVNLEIPRVVAAIVSKLMAKNAEDRYQSALGLKHDLEQCLTQWKQTKEITAFELGQQDICDRRLSLAVDTLSCSTELVEPPSATATAVFTAGSTHHSTAKSTVSGTTTVSSSLDLDSILKVSQALSSEIHLDKLLSTLMWTVLENAGADKGVLLMPEADMWFIEAVAVLGQPTRVESIALSAALPGNAELPYSLVDTIKHSLQPIVIADATTHSTLAADSYVAQHRPKSLVCTPILYQGKLAAILYLENRIAADVFTSDRVNLLNMLCTQAAISLENAKLYSRSQIERQRLIALLKNLPGMAYSCDNDADWTMRVVSEGCFLLTGYRPQELINNRDISYGALIHSDDAEMVDTAVQAAICDRTRFQVSYRIRTKQGQEKWVWEQGTGIFDEDSLLFIEGFITDVSDLKAAEDLVQEKNESLLLAMNQLKESQAQVIQSEKMSALGNLVAGVAHEINNPVGFLSGSVRNANDYIQDLLEHIALYRQQYPNAAEPIQEHAEDIDLVFLSEDLPKLIDSMQKATVRIKSISTSLRTFSRADTENRICANLYEGIDSTILILKYRLKANEHRPTIQIHKDYGELPAIECYPGQLNQVFMNILANAIDMFDEAAQQSTFAELEANPQTIAILSRLIEAGTVEIRIQDNGTGMSEAVRSRIFDHLFTTKGVGKGTGLGLAIAHQIVVEKHGGSLEVHSELGQGTEFVIRLPVS